MKKKKEDYTQEIILVCVATAAVVLLVIYIAVTNLGHSQAGYDAIKPEKSTESPRAKLDEERKEKEKEIEKQKQAAHGSAGDAKGSPLVPFGENPKKPSKRTNAADDVNAPLPTPHTFGGPTRAMDSPQ